LEFRRLQLTGFKSFADPVEIALLPGLTGIVGPNGCGKSNLTEAMRWAMGEARAGGLRADAMEDVIFAGARDRPGRNFAEVAIGLDQDGEHIEITRRIARGDGSTYRLNGVEARQRDVQLLFADAATGAHAAALVGQGRVAAVIAARPTERRAMLEEAAGIAGLAVRRKEAETRLRAASANLARVEDLGRELDAQVASLGRQARAAERYADLSTRIRVAQARLLFAGWRAADARAVAAARRSGEADAAVEAARGRMAAAEVERAAAADTAYRAREAEITMRAEAERLERARAGLAEERARSERRARELAQQADAVARDQAREGAVLREAREAVVRALAEAERIVAGAGTRERETTAERAAAHAAATALPRADATLADAMDARARALADRRVAEEAAYAATTRLARRADVLAQVTREHAALAALPPVAASAPRADTSAWTADAAHALAAAADAVEVARASLDAARATLDHARAALDTAQGGVNDAAAALAAARAEAAALSAEDAALARAPAPAAAVPLTVQPGYEAALAAALGDDLGAPIGVSGDGWARLVHGDDPALPAGAEPLGSRVDAPPQLARRLATIGVVPDRATGDALAPALAHGQRLVTEDGALWRWDGFERHRPANAAATQRLAAANRRAQLAALLAPARAGLAGRESAAAAEGAAQRAAADMVRAAETARSAATQRLAEAERARAAAERAATQAQGCITRARAEAEAHAARVRDEDARRDARRAALESALARAAEDRDEAARAAEMATAALAAAPVPADAEAALSTARAAAETARATATRANDRAAASERAIAESVRAEAAARDGTADWSRRAQAADSRLAELAPRIAEIAAEQAANPTHDAAAEARAHAAHTAAEVAEREAATARTCAEAALVDAQAQLSAATETRGVAREARAAIAVEAEHAAAAREELRRASLAAHGCEPPQLPGRFDFEPDDASVERREAELDRLTRDRERLGAVNLRALAELEEADTRATTLAAERQEIDTAIARLRGSIGALNRDGRTRLLATFEGVDRRFRQLFATLFEGGEARLALIDSDDPLDAGLEIFAKPPGKAAQSLALLSGGEQALTAVALLFAFFLENPSPICVLDEVDAPLDDANVERFCDLLREVAGGTATRFLVVTHNPVTMAGMDRLYGVTMSEPGVSQLVSVDLGAAEALLAAA